jgi:hypothetical protein
MAAVMLKVSTSVYHRAGIRYSVGREPDIHAGAATTSASMMEAAPNLKVVVFDSANPDFFIAHFQARLGARNPSAPKPDSHYPWTDFITRLSK